jgi:hypothetical protein
MKVKSMGKKILIVPDTQVKTGVSTDHIEAAGNFIIKHRPDIVVVLGDWWDMPSLSNFNSVKQAEGLRVLEDLDAGDAAMWRFMTPLLKLQNKQTKNKKKVYRPRLVFLIGNHDPQVRIPRWVEANPKMEGLLPADGATYFLQGFGFEVHDFLSVVDIEGIKFSHYFVNPHSARKSPVGGMIDTMLKNVGFSFVQGHQQGLKLAKHFLDEGTERLGIVAGSFYEHDEDYMGVQGNASHWRGIVLLDDVKNGSGDISEISLQRLKAEYL